MEKQPRQLTLLHVPEPPHCDALLLTRQLQQQASDYHEGLRVYINTEQAKAFQLPLLPLNGMEGEHEPSDAPPYLSPPCLPQCLLGLCLLEPDGKPCLQLGEPSA